MPSLLDCARKSNGAAPEWVRSVRAAGAERFAALGVPTPRLEDWKYTNLAPLLELDFVRAGEPVADDRVRAAVRELHVEGAIELVFVDGRFLAELSRVGAAPAGVRVTNLAEALSTDPEGVQRHFGVCADPESASLTALNAACLEEGALVQVGRGTVVAPLVHLLFLSRSAEAPTMSSPRTLIVAEESSAVTLVETYAGIGDGAYFTNAVTEIAVGANASVVHGKIQRESEGAFHIARIEARLDASSRFLSSSISLGAALARNDIGAVLDAEGAECSFDGLYVIDGRRHVDHHTSVDHRRPHCTSRELYKGVLDDRSTGVFNGKVIVRPDAQKSDAQQVNKNLLLSEAATINTKPQLEIFADDVKCSHGATIGRLDDQALFYLRSRGIDAADAREILVYAFANELVGRLPVESLRAGLERRLAGQLRRGAAVEASS